LAKREPPRKLKAIAIGRMQAIAKAAVLLPSAATESCAVYSFSTGISVVGTWHLLWMAAALTATSFSFEIRSSTELAQPTASPCCP
jgi:hypothetical protein